MTRIARLHFAPIGFDADNLQRENVEPAEIAALGNGAPGRPAADGLGEPAIPGQS